MQEKDGYIIAKLPYRLFNMPYFKNSTMNKKDFNKVLEDSGWEKSIWHENTKELVDYYTGERVSNKYVDIIYNYI